MIIDSNAPFCLTGEQLDRLDADAEARRRDKAESEKFTTDYGATINLSEANKRKLIAGANHVKLEGLPTGGDYGPNVSTTEMLKTDADLAKDEAEGEKFTTRYNGKQDTAYTR